MYEFETAGELMHDMTHLERTLAIGDNELPVNQSRRTLPASNIFIEITIAKFHVDIIICRIGLELSMVENLNDVRVRAPAQVFHCSDFIRNIFLRSANERTNNFPCKALQMKLVA